MSDVEVIELKNGWPIATHQCEVPLHVGAVLRGPKLLIDGYGETADAGDDTDYTVTAILAEWTNHGTNQIWTIVQVSWHDQTFVMVPLVRNLEPGLGRPFITPRQRFRDEVVREERGEQWARLLRNAVTDYQQRHPQDQRDDDTLIFALLDHLVAEGIIDKWGSTYRFKPLSHSPERLDIPPEIVDAALDRPSNKARRTSDSDE